MNIFTRGLLSFFTIFLFGLGANAADTSSIKTQISRFLDENPSAFCEGASNEDRQKSINAYIAKYTEKKGDHDEFRAIQILFHAFQVAKGNRLIAFLTPVGKSSGVNFDMRIADAWIVLQDLFAKNDDLVMEEYESIAWDDSQTLACPSYVFYRKSEIVNSARLAAYFKSEKRNARCQPKITNMNGSEASNRRVRDAKFVLEGYMLGYHPDNIESYFKRNNPDQCDNYQAIRSLARIMLDTRYGVKDPATLRNEPGK